MSFLSSVSITESKMQISGPLWLVSEVGSPDFEAASFEMMSDKFEIRVLSSTSGETSRFEFVSRGPIALGVLWPSVLPLPDVS